MSGSISNQTFVLMDVEADGPCPGLYSMVSFGAVILEPSLDKRFRANVAPISAQYSEEYLEICKVTREEHLGYPSPEGQIGLFVRWISEQCKGKPVFISDNLAFDWQFINYYCHLFAGFNPLGYTGRRIGDICSGAEKDLTLSSKWKSKRGTSLPHDPLEDALLNAKAFISTLEDHGMTCPSNQ